MHVGTIMESRDATFFESEVHMRIQNTAPSLLFWVALKFSPFRSSACMEDWKRRPSKPHPRLRHRLRCARRLGFWGASNVTAHYRSDRRHRLLSGGRSRDYRLASTVVRGIEQRTMLTSVHGATGALGMGPPLGIFLILLVLYSVRHLCC
jgi:hypothetical protein